MTDILEAMIEILKADSGVIVLVNDRVYGEELPREEIVNMPRKNVVLVSAGGIEKTKTDTLVNRRFDVWCYGETMYEAAALDSVVFDAIKKINRIVICDTLIHSAGLSGGPTKFRDPDSGWPAMIRSINVNADERSA